MIVEIKLRTSRVRNATPFLHELLVLIIGEVPDCWGRF